MSDRHVIGPSDPSDAALPAIEYVGPKLYFIDSDGRRWRVHDCAYGRGHARRLPLGDPEARYRYFVAKNHERRCFDLRSDDRSLTVAVLARQFMNAAYPRSRTEASGNLVSGPVDRPCS